MPKRARFEVIPFGDYRWDNPRGQRRAERIVRAMEERGMFLHGINAHGGNISVHDDVYMELMRTLGLHTSDDRGAFARLTGRLGLIQRAIRTAIDRRRRQAYLLLRRVLPIELASLTHRVGGSTSWRVD